MLLFYWNYFKYISNNLLLVFVDIDNNIYQNTFSGNWHLNYSSLYLSLFIYWNHKRKFFIYFYFCFFYLCIAYKGNKMFFTQNLSFKQFCPRKNPISITEIFLYYLGRNNRGLEDLIKQKEKYPTKDFFSLSWKERNFGN